MLVFDFYGAQILPLLLLTRLRFRVKRQTLIHPKRQICVQVKTIGFDEQVAGHGSAAVDHAAGAGAFGQFGLFGWVNAGHQAVFVSANAHFVVYHETVAAEHSFLFVGYFFCGKHICDALGGEVVVHKF